MYVLALRLALSHLRQKILSRLVVVVSVACILLMNSMVYVLFQNFSRSLSEIRSSQFMTVYLDSAVPASKEIEILSAVRKVPGVTSAQLVSKDSFLENFSKYFPQLSAELTTLDPETIPRFVKVKAERGIDGQALLKSIKGVETVELNRNRFAGLVGALATLRKLAAVLMGGMSVALLCILLNHFKLGTTFQSQVRRSLTLMGARAGYVYLPFAIEGLIEGALGGLVAASALLAYGRMFEAQMNSLFTSMGYHPYHVELTGLALGLVAVGTLSGMMGSLWATLRAK